MIRQLLVALLCCLLYVGHAEAASWTIRDSQSTQQSGCAGTLTITLNCSACSIIVIGTVENSTSPHTPTATDTVHSVTSNAISVGSEMWEITNPTHSSTYTVTLASSVCSAMAGLAADSAATTSPTDASTTNALACTSTTCQAASSVGTAGDLGVSMLTVDNTGTWSINSSFAILQQVPFSGGNAYGIVLAWNNASGGIASGVNPTWTGGGNGANVNVITGTFLPGGGGGGGCTAPPAGLSLLGVGNCNGD